MHETQHIARNNNIHNNDVIDKMKIKIEFACSNCLNIFEVEIKDVYFDEVRELHFTPEPECTYCGGTEDVVFSHYGEDQINNMIFRNQIRTGK